MDLRLWIRQICGFLVLSSILKNLLSQERYGPYIKLFMKLLLVLLLAKPFMQIDLERTGGIWREVSAQVSKSGWRQELSEMLEKGNAPESEAVLLLKEQLASVLAEKGYEPGELSLVCRESDQKIEEIHLTVRARGETVQEPVILRENEAYTGREREEELAGFLREKLGLSEEVELLLTIEEKGGVW